MSLTEVAVIFKRVSKFLIIFVILYYVYLLIIEPGARSAIRRAFVKETPPEPVYGKLYPLEFVEKRITGETPRYVLNTKNGKLPLTIPNKAVVYRYKGNQFSYLGGKRATEDAEKLGFMKEDMITDLKGTTYKWKSIKTGGLLEIQIESKELQLTTNLAGRNGDYIPGIITENSARESAQKMLSSIGRFDDALYPTGTSTVVLGNFTSSGIIPAQNTRDAQLAMVDFFRSIDSAPILGPDSKKGLLHAVVRIPPTKEEVSPLNYPLVKAYFWEVDPSTKATYPIITVEEAWNAVKENKGVVANVTPKGANPFEVYVPTRVESILIDRIYLAYYDTPKPQKYMQPIYVFEGKYTTKGTEGGYITIYLPAVTYDYIREIPPIVVAPSSPATVLPESAPTL
jgi:hypothetical protein